MIVGGFVTAIRRRPDRWVLDGHFVHDGPPMSAQVALRLGPRVLAETTVQTDATGALSYEFALSERLSFLLAQTSPIEIGCEECVALFSDEAEAIRASIAPDAAALALLERRIDNGHVLTRRGRLKRSLRDRDRAISDTLRHYRACDALVKKILGYNIHVAGGTLLGLLRGGAPIPHDLDFDVAYLSKHREPAAVKAEFLKLAMRLVELGEDVRVSPGSRRGNFLKWHARRASGPRSGPRHLDLFPAYIDEAGFYCRPTFVRIPGGADLILPLRRMGFAGATVWAPAALDRKVEAIFGADWRTPDMHWRKPVFPGARQAIAPLRLTEEEMQALDKRREARRGRPSGVRARGRAALQWLGSLLRAWRADAGSGRYLQSVKALGRKRPGRREP